MLSCDRERLKNYVNVTYTIQKKRDTRVIYANSVICVCPWPLPTKPVKKSKL